MTPPRLLRLPIYGKRICRGRAGTRPPSFCRKDFANKITPTQVQMLCSWVGAFLFIEGEIVCFVVFILWFML